MSNVHISCDVYARLDRERPRLIDCGMEDVVVVEEIRAKPEETIGEPVADPMEVGLEVAMGGVSILEGVPEPVPELPVLPIVIGGVNGD